MTSRRSFLQGTAAGMATVTMPSLLSGCGPKDALPAALAAPVATDPMLAWFDVDETSLQGLLSELGRHGADFADVFFQYSRSTYITMEDGIISRASTSIDQGVGLRTVVGDQTGYAFTEDLTAEAMTGAAQTAAAIARGGPTPGPVAFAYKRPSGLYSLEVPWDQVGVGQKLPLVEKLEGLARGLDPAIEKVTISWADNEERVLVAAMNGDVHIETRPMTRLWCQVTATRDGQTFSNAANLAGRQGLDFYTDERLAMLAKQAVDRTMILFDAIRPPAGELPVVLAAGASGILLHEAIGHGLEADFNRKGTSIYSDMMGKKIAPDFVTIVDSGTEKNERGAVAFDDEGTAGQRTEMVTNGVLTSYLHDQISARHYGVKGTGSGRRESFRHAPMPRMRCTFMEDGPNTRDEIIASVDKGIIAETFTNGQVQIGAGDFTFYIKNGWLIEGGKVTAPIKDVNIIGNGPEALQRVTMAANDGKLDTGGWTCGKDGQRVPVSQGLPTVLVSSLTVGGVDA
jgi:TldD protein